MHIQRFQLLHHSACVGSYKMFFPSNTLLADSLGYNLHTLHGVRYFFACHLWVQLVQDRIQVQLYKCIRQQLASVNHL